MPSNTPEGLDTVIVSIDGREHSRWSRYEIDSDLFVPADDFAVTLGVPDVIPEYPLALWQRVTVRVGGELVLTGRIDSPPRRYSKGEKTLSISGRDMAGVLCDCSAPIFTAQSVSLATVVSTIAGAFGIARVDVRTDGRREKVSIEPGMSAWDAIASACEINGCHPWFAPDGTLIIGGPDYTAPPVGTLYLGPNQPTNVLSLEVVPTISGYYSHVTVLGQAHGTAAERGQHDIKVTVTDDDLIAAGIYRPKIIVDGDAESRDYATKIARKALADGKFGALTIRATVRGHRAYDASGAGPVWQPGQRVRVVSEPDNLDAVFFLSARTLTGDDGGQKTRLTLKPDGVWLPDAGKRKKSGGKQTGGGQIINTWDPV